MLESWGISGFDMVERGGVGKSGGMGGRRWGWGVAMGIGSLIYKWVWDLCARCGEVRNPK